jgi:hypothetical protein
LQYFRGLHCLHLQGESSWGGDAVIGGALRSTRGERVRAMANTKYEGKLLFVKPTITDMELREIRPFEASLYYGTRTGMRL